MKLGELLADMVRYGDIHEAPFPEEWMQHFGTTLRERSVNYNKFMKKDPEAHTRMSIAATFLKITRKGEGGSCTSYDDLLHELLQQEVPTPKGL